MGCCDSHEKLSPGMAKAYRIAGELIRDKLAKEDPEAARELEDIKESDIVVVRGQYDHIEQVLRASGRPFIAISPGALATAELRADQVMFVNCPGQIDHRGLLKIEAFVEDGGFLFTTDWALKHILQQAFPGYVEFNGRATGDEVIRVEVLAGEDPMLKTMLGPEDDPQWWLEGSSYPIRVLAPDKVRVLVRSKELGDRYGEPAVFVSFDYGEGKIYHMISHYYLQRTETRTLRQRASGEAYLAEKGIPPELAAKYAAMGVSSVSLGQVEAALSSRAMTDALILEKKRRLRQKEKEAKGDGAPPPASA